MRDCFENDVTIVRIILILPDNWNYFENNTISWYFLLTCMHLMRAKTNKRSIT